MYFLRKCKFSRKSKCVSRKSLWEGQRFFQRVVESFFIRRPVRKMLRQRAFWNVVAVAVWHFGEAVFHHRPHKIRIPLFFLYPEVLQSQKRHIQHFPLVDRGLFRRIPFLGHVMDGMHDPCYRHIQYLRALSIYLSLYHKCRFKELTLRNSSLFISTANGDQFWRAKLSISITVLFSVICKSTAIGWRFIYWHQNS